MPSVQLAAQVHSENIFIAIVRQTWKTTTVSYASFQLNKYSVEHLGLGALRSTGVRRAPQTAWDTKSMLTTSPCSTHLPTAKNW